MASELALEGVSKDFVLRHNRADALKLRFVGLFNPAYRERLEVLPAVRDVTFELARGEWVGIVGRNGSGKSTLLRLMAGILAPTRGRVRVRREARLVSLIELGVGFQPELTAVENVFLQASLFGIDSARTRRMLPRVAEFSELGSFMDVPLKSFSSGMSMRLAFSVAMAMDPEVLLLDEVLAVGDVAFQQKCMERTERLRQDGCTVALVTHDLALVERVCARLIVMDGGRVVHDGDVRGGLARYQALLTGHAAGAPPELRLASGSRA
jgi:ABC-2 type transport system ATP-binding protein/lipopolysaccharide transport system ATP-binding protein